MSEPSRDGGSVNEQHKRKLRNFLLDRRFQLKYAGYLMLIALVIGAVMGAILLRTSGAVVAQSLEAVRQGEAAVERGQQMLAESEKVSAVVRMNIVNDPSYAENPALREAFTAESSARESRLLDQHEALRSQAEALRSHSKMISARQRTLLVALFAALAVLVVAIGLGGIVVTHRVAGPVHKMKRQLSVLGAGSLRKPGSLRRGDELADFFQAFNDAVEHMRRRQEAHIAELDVALTQLGDGEERARATLKQLRAELSATLES
jgi:nitrogen fixation/metabolism regulation signal transduction histidine kinase